MAIRQTLLPETGYMDKTAASLALLVVDDDRLAALAFQQGLKQIFQCQATAVVSGQEALRLLAQQPVDLLITDYHMPKMDGLALAAQVRRLYPDVPIIMIASYSGCKLREQTAGLAIRHVLTKPVSLMELRAAVLDALRQQLESTEASCEECIPSVLADWIRQQAAQKRPDLATRQVMDLLDQWEPE